jgi:hypothetical protein
VVHVTEGPELDAALERLQVLEQVAREQLGLFERVVPGLVQTLKSIQDKAFERAASMGVTVDGYRAMSFDEREDLLIQWRKKSPPAKPPCQTQIPRR